MPRRFEIADVTYKCSTYYDAATERGFAYDDEDVGIVWPQDIALLVSERARVGKQVLRAQPPLVLEQHVVHLPEPVLGTGRLGGLGGLVRMRVDLTQWKVSVGEPEIVAECLLQRLRDGMSRAAVRALVVAVLDDEATSGPAARDSTSVARTASACRRACGSPAANPGESVNATVTPKRSSSSSTNTW